MWCGLNFFSILDLIKFPETRLDTGMISRFFVWFRLWKNLLDRFGPLNLDLSYWHRFCTA